MAYKIQLFFTILSFAAGYVTEFFLPYWLATKLIELANYEILRGTKLSAAFTVAQEAIFNENPLVLEVTLLSKVISVVLGFSMNSRKPFYN